MKSFTEMTDAEACKQCRENGWGPRTRLVGDEGFGPTVIELTAVGERHVLAKQISHNGKPRDSYESCWTLACRDWKEVAAKEEPSDGKV